MIEVVRPPETQVLVSILEDYKLGEAAKLASELWEADIKAEYLVSKRSQKHIDRARSSGRVIVGGKTELSQGVVTLKETVTGSEEKVPRDCFVAELLKRLLTSLSL